MSEQVTGLELRKSVIVARPPEEAFRLYTEGIASWWPVRTHSVAKEDAETAIFEPREGGRIYERTTSGEEHVWGTVREWEPPRRFVHAWHPGRTPDTAQVVEATFVPAGGGTLVEIVHRGWEALGTDAQRIRETYDSGWDFVLGRYVQTAGG